MPVKFHKCTAADLEGFYKLRGEEELITKMMLQMNCVDKNQTIEFSGDWAAELASFLVVDFFECQGSGCYNKAVIKEKFESYHVYAVHNSQDF